MSHQEDEKEEEEETRDPRLDQVMDLITKNYRPADSIDAADLRLTTTEVYELVKQHYPAPTFDAADVYSVLDELGYKPSDVYGDLQLRWLLQRLS